MILWHRRVHSGTKVREVLNDVMQEIGHVLKEIEGTTEL